MKRKSLKLISLMLVLMLALSFSACGGGSEDAGTSEDGQNPIMNYVGNYQCDRATIFISAEDSGNAASAVVTWGSSATENSSWMMTGTFDSDSLQFEYHDCVRTNYVYKDNGDVESQEEVYTGGHGFMTFYDDEKLTLAWQDDQEHVADDMVFEYVGALSGNEGESTGMQNPWKTAETLDAAAEGAGLDGFTLDDPQLSLGEFRIEEYRYMDGIAEIKAGTAAVGITIRKGLASAAAEEGDISGDYNTYAHEWTQNIKGLEVKCYGNREGEATKAIWGVDDYLFSVNALGLGGDDDFGLSADDLNSLINSMQ